MLCYVMLRYVTLRDVTLRYVTLRYVMLCYVMYVTGIKVGIHKATSRLRVIFSFSGGKKSSRGDWLQGRGPVAEIFSCVLLMHLVAATKQKN